MELNSIEEFLRPLVDEKVYFHAHTGNGGDCLISAGTFTLFDRIGLRYELVREHVDPDKLRDGVLVMAGGGNIAPIYQQVRRFLEDRHAAPRRVILLPHTITGHGDLIAQFGDNVDVICRERMSLEYVQQHARDCRVWLTHDMALHIDVAQLMAEPLLLGLASPKEYGRLARHFYRRLTMPSPEAPAVYNCYRADKEKTAMAVPGDNIDLPAILAPGTRPAFLARLGARDVLATLNRAETINTNRLHMAIGGCLLGKTVNFHDNNYGKNRAVYEYSLRGRYPKLTWMG